MSRLQISLIILALLCAFAGCEGAPANGSKTTTVPAVAEAPRVQPGDTADPSQPPAAVPAAQKTTTPVYVADVRARLPHDPEAFTQGLIVDDGAFLESTGLRGRSTLRRVDIHTGKVLQKVAVPSQYFAEGMTVLKGKIYQITWQEHTCFVYDEKSFANLGKFTYSGEGWGLTTDGTNLIMSDGTNAIRFIDPATFKVIRTIKIANPVNGRPLDQLNELEYIKGEVYANIWQTDVIARIDPHSGKVVGWIDLSDLFPVAQRGTADVLNGIAYDSARDALYVTGKLWPTMFEIALKRKQ